MTRTSSKGRALSVRTVVWAGTLVGAALLLMWFVEFPVPPFPGHLKYSPSEVPVLIGTFALGPLAGMVMQAVKSALYLLLSGKGEPVGVTANIVSGAAWAAIAGVIYRWRHDRTGAVIGLVAGTVAMTVVMIPANVYVFWPLYGIPREAFAGLIVPGVLFNLFKGLLTGIIVFLLYKRVRRFL